MTKWFQISKLCYFMHIEIVRILVISVSGAFIFRYLFEEQNMEYFPVTFGKKSHLQFRSFVLKAILTPSVETVIQFQFLRHTNLQQNILNFKRCSFQYKFRHSILWGWIDKLNSYLFLNHLTPKNNFLGVQVKRWNLRGNFEDLSIRREIE